MKTALEWDELLTCAPMNAKEALASVRIKPSEIEQIQTDANAHLIAALKEARGAINDAIEALHQSYDAQEWPADGMSKQEMCCAALRIKLATTNKALGEK